MSIMSKCARGGGEEVYYIQSFVFLILRCFGVICYVLAMPVVYLLSEGWWSALEPRHFNRLVCSLVSALHQLVDQEPTNDAAALTLCQILATLNRINNEYKKIALDKFYLTILKEKVDISNDYARWAFGVSGLICFRSILVHANFCVWFVRTPMSNRVLQLGQWAGQCRTARTG